MKWLITVLFLSLTFCGYVKAEEKKIIGRILSSETPMLLKTSKGRATANWDISEDIIDSAQPILLAFLKDKGKKWSRFQEEVYDHLEDYRCQYIGVVINGSHQIFCNFFLYSEEENSNWEKVIYPIGLEVSGGGLNFFQFIYEINEGKCKEFRYNGP